MKYIEDRVVQNILKVLTIPTQKDRVRAIKNSLNRSNELLEIMFSISLLGLKAPTMYVRTNTTTSSNTFMEVLGEAFYYVNLNLVDEYRELFIAQCLLYQQSLSLVFGGKILTKISEIDLLYNLKVMYTKNELVNMLPVPVKEVTVIESVDRGTSEITFPSMLFNLTRSPVKAKLFYLIKRGDSIVSNSTLVGARKSVIASVNMSTFGVIFSVHRHSNYKRKHKVTIICYGSIDDILLLYKGGKTDLSKINIAVKYKEFIDKSIFDSYLVATNNIHNMYVIHARGIDSIKYKTKKVIVSAIDYILNDDYEPIGIVVEYKGISYDIKVNPKHLNNLFECDKFKVWVTQYKDLVLSLKFIGVVNK